MNKKVSQQLKIVFIGAGNMAEALVKGMIDSGIYPKDNITVTDISEERLMKFSDQFGVRTISDNAVAVQTADVIVLAVKPQVMNEVLTQISRHTPEHTLVISIAAGITTSFIENAFQAGTRVIRVMPNTPALVGKGVSAYCKGKHALEQDETATESILDCVGTSIKTEEQHMDAVTALSGSGPAYVFLLAEIMINAGTTMGLDPDISVQLALDTLAGASAMLQQTGLEPAELRRRVTSKGGTTEAALQVLEKENIKATWQQAILTAQKRAGELSGK